MPWCARLACAAALIAEVRGVMRPPLQALDREGQESKSAGLSSGGAARKTCPAAYDAIAPDTDAGPAALVAAEDVLHADALGASGSPGRGGADSSLRDCPDTHTLATDLLALVIPKYKLAFCYIPKVACTQFKDLFNYINGASPDEMGFGKGYWRSQYPFQGVRFEDMTKENGWKFAAFTRDPALRYLSAYGDMCLVEDPSAPLKGHNRSCCGPPAGVNAPTERQAADFRARVQLDLATGRPAVDQHWASQVETLKNCGWDQFNPEHLDYWGILAGDVNAQVKEMMRMAGHADDAVVDRFFPKEGVKGHTSLLAGEPLDYIQDEETLKGIVQLYVEDYEMLPGVGCAFTEPLLAKLKGGSAGAG